MFGGYLRDQLPRDNSLVTSCVRSSSLVPRPSGIFQCYRVKRLKCREGLKTRLRSRRYSVVESFFIIPSFSEILELSLTITEAFRNFLLRHFSALLIVFSSSLLCWASVTCHRLPYAHTSMESMFACTALNANDVMQLLQLTDCKILNFSSRVFQDIEMPCV